MGPNSGVEATEVDSTPDPSIRASDSVACALSLSAFPLSHFPAFPPFRFSGSQRSVLRRKARPFTAMSSRFGSILRQMAAARAITFTSVVNDSITTSPW